MERTAMMAVRVGADEAGVERHPLGRFGVEEEVDDVVEADTSSSTGEPEAEAVAQNCCTG